MCGDGVNGIVRWCVLVRFDAFWRVLVCIGVFSACCCVLVCLGTFGVHVSWQVLVYMSLLVCFDVF